MLVVGIVEYVPIKIDEWQGMLYFFIMYIDDFIGVLV